MDEMQTAIAAVTTRVSAMEDTMSSVEKTLGLHDIQFSLIMKKLNEMGSALGLGGGTTSSTAATQGHTAQAQVPFGAPQTHNTGNETAATPGTPAGTEQAGRGIAVTPAASTPRMELPSFDGTDPIAWLAQAEQYFLVHQTPVADRVQLALIAMSGKSMFWAQWVLRHSAAITWIQFTQELLERFGDSSAINAYEAMQLTRQTGSLEDFLSLFEERVAQLPSLPPEQYLGMFLGGLQPSIRDYLSASDCSDVFAAIRAARRSGYAWSVP